MTGYSFEFLGVSFQARPSAALWWPEAGWLVVADLHLGKSGRMARRGGALLPPYETRETLDRLRQEIDGLAPRRVISLGDGFDDVTAAAEIDPEMRALIHAMAAGREWLWVTGNHDPLSGTAALPGDLVPMIDAGPIRFRHEARDDRQADISGHYHPVLRLGGVRRRAFLIGQNHLILPAFGVYTGGLAADEEPLSTLVPGGIAAACCGAQVLPVPLGAHRATKKGR